MQAHGFRFYFTPLHGVLPTFPSRYWSAIGLRQSLALRDGPRGFGQDSTCPALLRCRIGLPRLARTGVSPSAPSLSRKFRFVRQSISPVLQPRHVREHDGLGSSLFDRHYWGNRLFLSPPPGTKMFQFPGFAPDTVWCTAFSRAGFPIRTSADHSLFATTRSFSQLTTSFFAFGSLGIPRSL